ncbi:hypothetical protein HRI_004420600 [Hibiscus trionum]|uniref:RRM domain-containing protein n=1 Tax=Hibiscus trionum TaxID=183268 RepID=A0A9W7J942_HIBTR|nr:hypothetical protein HRI_004420600 [Hibiscus trionum]
MRRGENRGKDHRFSNDSTGVYKIFIDNLSRRVSRGALWELFNHYGRVERVLIPTVNNKTKYRKSTFAFVTLRSEKDLQSAIVAVHNTKIDGLLVSVTRARFPLSSNGGFVFASKAGGQWQSKSTHGAAETSGPRQPRAKAAGLGAQHAGGLPRENNKTYTEALLNNDNLRGSSFEGQAKDNSTPKNPGKGSLLDFDIPNDVSVWIKASAVGIIKDSFEMDFV